MNHHVDTMRLELTLHTLICGRGRKNIKHIESATDTAIYFPPPFPGLFAYHPPGAQTRLADELIITGKTPENILAAKKKMHDLVISTKSYVKDVAITATKIDNIILERLDKVRKITEANGSYVLFPPLGMQRGVVRIQGTDVLNCERTAREVMTIVSFFFSVFLSLFEIVKIGIKTQVFLTYHRLANSTALHGGFSNPMHRSVNLRQVMCD